MPPGKLNPYGCYCRQRYDIVSVSRSYNFPPNKHSKLSGSYMREFPRRIFWGEGDTPRTSTGLTLGKVKKKAKNTALDFTAPARFADLRFTAHQPESAMGGGR